MTALRVIGVDLFSRLSDLLDDNKRSVLLDHAFDLSLDMLGNNDELIRFVEDWFVGARVNLDLLETTILSALAVQRHRRADLVEGRALLDLPVHV
jgi:hypothetical protein